MRLVPVLQLFCVSFLIYLCYGKKRKSTDIIEAKVHDQFDVNDNNNSMHDVITRVCMSDDTDRLVYRFQNETHIFIGFDVVNDDVIYTMVWKMTKDKDQIEDQNRKVGEYDRSSSLRYRPMLSKRHLLAATNKGEQRKLKRDLCTCRVGEKTFTMTCLIDVFAERAQAMKVVSFSDNCTGKIS